VRTFIGLPVSTCRLKATMSRPGMYTTTLLAPGLISSLRHLHSDFSRM
jgi:hypothetical protein